MKFTPAEIEKAIELKAKGLTWVPSVSHYVWDESPASSTANRRFTTESFTFSTSSTF